MASNEECIVCQKTLPDDGRFMRCVDCKEPYHLGQNCSGIAPNTFNTMGTQKREVWVCKTCRTSKKRTGSTSQQSPQPTDNSGALAALMTEIQGIKRNVESLPELLAKVDSLLMLKAEFTRLCTVVNDVEETVKFLSAKYDDVVEQLKADKEEASAHRKEMNQLQEKMLAQELLIHRLQQGLNDSEQYNRNANMEIHGLKSEEGENLTEFLHELAEKLELQKPRNDEVLAVHRLPSKKASPPILVRFASVAVRNRWFAARGKLQSLFKSEPSDQLYFNENLTQINRRLLWLARTTGKKEGYKFVWVRGGKIFVKKDEGATLIRITCDSDIDRIK